MLHVVGNIKYFKFLTNYSLKKSLSNVYLLILIYYFIFDNTKIVCITLCVSNMSQVTNKKKKQGRVLNTLLKCINVIKIMYKHNEKIFTNKTR